MAITRSYRLTTNKARLFIASEREIMTALNLVPILTKDFRHARNLEAIADIYQQLQMAVQIRSNME